MKRHRQKRRLIRGVFGVAMLFVLAIIGYRWTINAPVYVVEEPFDLYIADTGMTSWEALAPLRASGHLYRPTALQTLNSLRGNPKAQRGHYRITSGMGLMQLLRKIEFGYEDPIWLRIRGYQKAPAIETQLTEVFGYTADSAHAVLAKHMGFNQVIPNSYQVYWSYRPKDLAKRLTREHEVFWNPERLGRAARMGLSAEQVVVLASIAQAETKQRDELPRVAGLYLARLKIGKRLEADPTVVWAYLDRYPNAGVIRRVTTAMTNLNHPYNTYRRDGLPPGPLTTVEPEVIDAVLKAEAKNEIYMCADPDRPGYHAFARTYAEHLRNAARYHASLNRRGIRR